MCTCPSRRNGQGAFSSSTSWRAHGVLTSAAAGGGCGFRWGHLPPSSRLRQLELIQVRTQRGPMPDALRAGAAVTSRELATEGLRWPEFAAAATMSGFMSVAAVPMIAARQTVGAIDFFGADDALIAGDNR